MSAATTTDVIRFLGLSDVADTTTGQASFPLGILYPYSQDLRRVCACYDDLADEDPGTAAALLGGTGGAPGALPDPKARTAESLLAAIATLHRCIVFAPGPAGASVAAAYRRASDTLASPRL